MSPARHQRQRQRSAADLAKESGFSERSIRRYVAEPRDSYVERAVLRRVTARKLQQDGLSYTDIAERMSMSVSATKSLLHRARQNADADGHHLSTQQPPPKTASNTRKNNQTSLNSNKSCEKRPNHPNPQPVIDSKGLPVNAHPPVDSERTVSLVSASPASVPS
jgi:predicted DNA-binding transcriptional regulator YafY